MLRLETESGWWLVTHPDHARLAGAFAERWGNDRFLAPEPRLNVLKGIARHDDGWTGRDAAPQITRQGKPSAFSVELVGKYSAFEEIDLADYLAVRDRAVRLIAEEDAYPALLISMHTYSLLSEHADRSTIAPEELPLLDGFLEKQKIFQNQLLQRIAADPRFVPSKKPKRPSSTTFASCRQPTISHYSAVWIFLGPLICCIRCRCAEAGTLASRCIRRALATLYSIRIHLTNAR